jgi:hypothetical protein
MSKLVPKGTNLSDAVIVTVSGIAWGAGTIPGNSYAVYDLGAMTPAASPGPALAIFDGQDINVGLVINVAEIDGSGNLIIQILNTIPASVGPALTPEGSVNALYNPA